jgi:hypothetical protein
VDGQTSSIDDVSRFIAGVQQWPRNVQERVVAGATAVGVVVFVLARWAVAAHRDLSRFVVVGSSYSRSRALPKYLHVFARSRGYDGQFYWRLATDPAHLGLRFFHGIRIDSYYRLNRILYPVLVWVLSLGHERAVDVMMVVVNAIAILGVMVVGLWVARRRQVSPFWAFALLAIPGLVGALSRDLTEALATALAVAAVAAIRADRHWWGVVLLTGAVLARETTLLLVAVYGAFALWDVVRGRRRFGTVDLVWVVPAVVMAAWQGVAYDVTGHVPLLSSAGSGDVGVPLVGFFEAIPSWFSPASSHQLAKGALYVAQTVAFVAVLGAVWRARAELAMREMVIVATFALLVICETKQGWVQPFDARYAAVPMAISWMTLIGTRSTRWRWAALAIALPVTAATVAWRVVVI